MSELDLEWFDYFLNLLKCLNDDNICSQLEKRKPHGQAQFNKLLSICEQLLKIMTFKKKQCSKNKLN